MSAPVIVFDTADTSPSAREHRLRRRWSDAHRALHAGLSEARLIAGGVGNPNPTPLGQLLQDDFSAACDLQGYLERRVKQVERALTSLLAEDAVSDDQRTRVLEILHGKRPVSRDMKILAPYERDVIEQYRAMDVAGRTLIRLLFERLATSHAQ